MITSDARAYGLPGADELEALANAIFPDLGASELTSFMPEQSSYSSGQLVPAPEQSASVLGQLVSAPEQSSSALGQLVSAPEQSSSAPGQPVSAPEQSASALGQPVSVAAQPISQAISAISDGGAPAWGGFYDAHTVPYPKSETVAPQRYAPQVFSQTQAAEARRTIDAPASVGGDRVSHTERRTSADSRDEGIVIGGRTLRQIREDFPILSEKINGNPLVWLDNGATTQRPRAVIDRLSYFYEHENSNVHRGAHELAARSTDAYENARQITADFIGAPSKDDVVFVRGTTEGINLVAHAYVKQYLEPGDEIIVSILEHHANIVPWQLIAQETGAILRVIPCDESGQLILSEYERLFNKNTKFVSVTQVSNVLGTVTPVEELIAIAHRHGVRILIDGAQSVAHLPVNVAALDADFFVFSGHKIFAPTGIGAVYGKKELLEAAHPYHGGGNMILDVTFERTIYNPAPNKFEAGTGSIADAVGLGAALEYLNALGMPEVNRWEQELLSYALPELKKIKGLHLLGTASHKASALAFKLDGYSDEEVGQRLNQYGIAVRTGHHCAQPVLRRFGLESAVRPTLALYNSPDDVDALVKVLRTFA